MKTNINAINFNGGDVPPLPPSSGEELANSNEGGPDEAVLEDLT